jgi:hypothetical protein
MGIIGGGHLSSCGKNAETAGGITRRAEEDRRRIRNIKDGKTPGEGWSSPSFYELGQNL